MALSFVRRSGDGSTTTFTFSFTGQDEGYINKEDILVEVDGDETPFTLASSNTLEITPAPASGKYNILIRRVMPKDRTYADFKTGNNFGQEVLNNSFLQTLYVIHEILDGWFPDDFKIRVSVDYLNGLRSYQSDPEDPLSVVNFEEADKKYLPRAGGNLQGFLEMNGYPLFVRKPTSPSEPVRNKEYKELVAKVGGDKADLIALINSKVQDLIAGYESGDAAVLQELRAKDSQISSSLASAIAEYRASISDVEDEYQSADASLQAQISDTAPLQASAFSPVSWHAQEITNSVSIPPNKNAWSFGDVLTIAPGVTVTIADGSVWTIANGEGTNITADYDGGIL